MTPQEKSEQLVSRYLFATPIGFHIEDAKKCAIIAVEEIMKLFYRLDDEYKYWQNVKTEIEKL
jgi:hypothetical protein